MKLRPAEFARQAGVTKQAINGKIKNKTLAVDAAGFLDTDNPINSAYISDPGRKARKAAALPLPALQAAPGSSGDASPAAPGMAAPALASEAEIAAAAGVPADLLNMTMREIVMQFHGLYNLSQHAKILRDMTITAEREQRTAERAMSLIPKDFVTSRVFPFLNILMRQLIEYPESAVDNLIAKVLSDGPAARDAVIVMLRDGLSRIIAGSKETVINELNGLRGRHSLGKDRLEDTEAQEAAGE